MDARIAKWEITLGPWVKKAACRGAPVEWFVPDNSGRHGVNEKNQNVQNAKRICMECPVRVDCLEYAVENGMPGVWGGTTDRQRRKIRERGKG